MNWQLEAWVKLYKREEGTFASLSFLARGVAAMLLKHADKDGRIGLRPGEQLWQAMCGRAGAKRHERKLIRKLIEELETDGYVTTQEGAAYIRNYSEAQKRKQRHPINDNKGTRKEDEKRVDVLQRSSSGAPTELQRVSNGASAGLERGSSGSPAVLGREAKSLELFNSETQHAGTHAGTRAAESNRNELDHLPAPSPRKQRTRKSDLFNTMVQEFCSQWQNAYGGPYSVSGQDRKHFGEMLSGLSPEVAYSLPELFRRYFADATGLNSPNRHALWWFSHSGGVNKYQGQRKAVGAQRSLVDQPEYTGKYER